MSKKMLINASHPEENRVAIVVDGILSELDIEIAGQEQTKGNIYKAVVARVEPGLQAAFVDYGAEKMGFLQIGEIHPKFYPTKEGQETKNRPRINEILQRGQELLVQIVKEERGTKGAALTTFLSLPGRYMVLMPDSKTKGVSRKISDEQERKELKRNMAALDLPERMGYIVRTAGIGKEPEELKRDFDYLVNLYQGILKRNDQVKAPAQLYQESNLAIRTIRDYFTTEMDEVLIDDDRVYRDAKDFFSLVMPEHAGLVKQHREKRPIFSRFQIEEQIEGLARNQIPLPSGGSIVIDQTEALVAIDVNSGKMSSESGIEATAGKTNLEAATEIGRQLRLRDLGGLIVIDFIDMRDRKRIRDVEDALRKSLRDDKAKVTVGRISQFGLLEMSRQRIKAALSVGAYLDCPHCQGKGRIKSVEAQAVALLRQFHASASKGHIGKIEARVPLAVATYLLNEKRTALGELEKHLDLSILIQGRPEFIPGQVEVELHKRERQSDSEQDTAPISHANQIEGALAAAREEEQQILPAEQDDKVEATDAPEESTSRKRRRRRRKRSDRGEKTEALPSPDTVATDAAGQATADDAPEPLPSGEGVSGEAAEGTTPVKAGKSRSRRGSRKKAAPETAADKATQSSHDGATPETAAAEPIAADESQSPEPPKKRPRRKPAAQKAADPVGVEAADSDKPAEEAAASRPGKSRARRGSRKKTAPDSAAGEAAQTTPAVVVPETAPAEPSAAGENKSPEPPRKRPRRKTATKKTAATADSSDGAETTVGQPAAPAEEVKAKPKSRSRKKSPPQPPAEQSGQSIEGVVSKVEAAVAMAEGKPQPRTQQQSPQQPNESGQDRQESSAKGQPAAKPRRRSPRKTTDRKKDDTAVAQEAQPEKPKRRSPRKKTSSPAEQSPTGD